jgi:hypothetical protein
MLRKWNASKVASRTLVQNVNAKRGTDLNFECCEIKIKIFWRLTNQTLMLRGTYQTQAHEVAHVPMVLMVPYLYLLPTYFRVAIPFQPSLLT